LELAFFSGCLQNKKERANTLRGMYFWFKREFTPEQGEVKLRSREMLSWEGTRQNKQLLVSLQAWAVVIHSVWILCALVLFFVVFTVHNIFVNQLLFLRTQTWKQCRLAE